VFNNNILKYIDSFSKRNQFENDRNIFNFEDVFNNFDDIIRNFEDTFQNFQNQFNQSNISASKYLFRINLRLIIT